MSINNLGLRQRLIAGFAVVIVVFVVALGYVVLQMGEIADATTTAQNQTEEIEQAESASSAVLELNRLVLWVVADGNAATVAAVQEMIPPIQEQLDGSLARLEELALGEAARERIA